jgi:hypothetical protein
MGGLEESLELLREITGTARDIRVVEGPKEDIPLLRTLFTGLADEAARALARLGREETAAPRWQLSF